MKLPLCLPMTARLILLASLYSAANAGASGMLSNISYDQKLFSTNIQSGVRVESFGVLAGSGMPVDATIVIGTPSGSVLTPGTGIGRYIFSNEVATAQFSFSLTYSIYNYDTVSARSRDGNAYPTTFMTSVPVEYLISIRASDPGVSIAAVLSGNVPGSGYGPVFNYQHVSGTNIQQVGMLEPNSPYSLLTLIEAASINGGRVDGVASIDLILSAVPELSSGLIFALGAAAVIRRYKSSTRMTGASGA